MVKMSLTRMGMVIVIAMMVYVISIIAPAKRKGFFNNNLKINVTKTKDMVGRENTTNITPRNRVIYGLTDMDKEKNTTLKITMNLKPKAITM